MKKTKGGVKALNVILSNSDYETAIAADVDWLRKAAISDTIENPNVELLWDQKLGMFKLRLLVKEFVDGNARCKKASN